LKPWHIFCEPSQGVERFKRWSVYAPAIPVCSQPRLLNRRDVTPVLSSRRHTVEKATKCPEPLCPTSALPPLGRCVPSPLRALPLRHRSYGLMCHSRWALSSFGIEPRSKSLCRLYAVPAAHGSFPTLSLKVFPRMLDPVPRRYTVCSHLFLPRCRRPSPSKEWVGFPRLAHEITTSRRSVFRGCRYSVMFRPPSLLAPQIVPTAASTAAGQPGLLRPGLSCFVTSARTGYANRPNTGN
jgi:hypothetical protein